ncbi:hypothetical protein BBC27_11045 [Acidithiobacillus ferrivorans]|uniref:Uncharacterized protein n=1 Tax=Acidithiobacillus ferrivorans TaxID=160808 RepID=A0A1B9BYV3_9PROT|nr:hypothetical protein BBC27_11045 [Acidithiobacillus ferrivorans]
MVIPALVRRKRWPTGFRRVSHRTARQHSWILVRWKMWHQQPAGIVAPLELRLKLGGGLFCICYAADQGETLNFESPDVFLGRLTALRWFLVRLVMTPGGNCLSES